MIDRKIAEIFPVKVSLGGRRCADGGFLTPDEIAAAKDFFSRLWKSSPELQAAVRRDGVRWEYYDIPDGSAPPVEGMPVPVGGAVYSVCYQLIDIMDGYSSGVKKRDKKPKAQKSAKEPGKGTHIEISIDVTPIE